jgi:hypothetical protein
MGRLSESEFAEVIGVLENLMIRRFVCGVPTYGLNKSSPHSPRVRLISPFPDFSLAAISGLSLTYSGGWQHDRECTTFADFTFYGDFAT